MQQPEFRSAIGLDGPKQQRSVGQPVGQPAYQVVDLRCPEDQRTLLMRYRMETGQPAPVSDNLLELNCRSCTRNARQFDSSVANVLHRFDLAGQLVESLVVR